MLALDHVGKTYPNGVRAVHDVSLEVEPGEIVVIIGGMGNLRGTAIAGLGLGLAESYAGGFATAAMRDGISFAAMISMLLLRPQGLFGKTVRV